MADLPLLELGADPYQRGLLHGQTMASAIRDNLETYLRRFEAGGVSREAAQAEGVTWVEVIASHSPEYAEEMRGLAEGSGLPLSDIAMLNARYEIIYSVFGGEAEAVAGRGAEPDGCTSFGALPEATASGHTLIGQNWDWLSGIKGRTLILRVRRPEKPDFVGFTEAGIVGCKMGVNEAGIGLVVNGLVSDEDGRTPYQKAFHLRCREVLDAWSMDKALLALIESDRVGSANVMLGHGDGEVIDIEASPRDANYLYPQDGLITHANHFVHPKSVASRFERITPSTLYRAARLDRLLRRHLGRLETAHFEDALRDHFSRPASICRHEDPTQPEAKRGCSVTSAIIDLSARTLYATDGPPCENPYQAFSLAAPEARRESAAE
ncbi:MAG: C45 family autoproteolytic acyltransferase/hydrolase [Alphaproteobacteria bacterium]|nr:C45 family autoproteolytic acyltransferase/hydrolase [Alphaproteobacteria bacterium]